MAKKIHTFISKSLYAIMLAPVQPINPLSQQIKSVIYPNRPNYGRLTACINLLDRIIPSTSKYLSSRIVSRNHYPWHSLQPTRLIGSGAVAAVFKLDDLAFHIYRKSYGDGLTTAFSTVKLYRQYYNTLNTWYQNKHGIILPMHFLILNGPPLFQPTAASLQPYLPSSRKDLINDFTHDQLLALAQAHPAFKQSLLFFLDQTIRAYYQENACPDLLGDDNIVIVYRAGLPHIHILDIGILYLDYVKVTSPQRIPLILAAIQRLEILHDSLSQLPNSQTGSNSPIQSPSSLSTTNTLTTHIQTHAFKYYPQLDLQTIRIQLAKKESRLTSSLYFFDISDQFQTKSVVIKVAHPKPEGSNTHYLKKPRLYPPTDPSAMSTLEHQALSTIQKHFQYFDPLNISTIKTLDYLPDKHAIVMEAAELPNLRTRYLHAARRFPVKLKQPIILAFQNAGRWLHRFHNLPIEDHVQTRQAYSKDFCNNIALLTDYLIKITRREKFFNKLTAQITTLANQHLPRDLPLGLGHGDFAARNILVNNQFTITVIDTFAKWNAPIYEDIGYFLNDISTSWYQVATFDLIYSPQRIATFKNSFLTSYFQDTPIPHPQIILYEILALLDKWSDAIDRINSETHRRGLKTSIFPLTVLYYKNQLNKLIKEIQVHNYSRS